MPVREGVQLVHQPFRMHPTQCVLADGKLPGIVAQQHGLTQEAMCTDAAPLRPLGGDLGWVLDDRQTGVCGRDLPKILWGLATAG